MIASMKAALPQAWIDHDRKLKPYLWRHRILWLFSTAVSLSLVAVTLFTPLAKGLEGWAQSLTSSGFLQWLLFFGALGLIFKIVSLPFSMWHHHIERSFQLSKQNWRSWGSDQAKAVGLGAVLGAAALGLIYLAMTLFPSSWWLACSLLLIMFSIVLAQLTPVLLIPLFFKMNPMEGGDLKDRLLALCRKFNIEVKDVYHLGLGEKTEKGNAAFLGLGRTKRIVIGDTLYEKFHADEVEAVFAHELGHQVHNDMWKGIFFAAFSMILAFYVGFQIAETWVLPHWEATAHSPFGLWLFFIALSIVQMPLGVIQALYSRNREWAADRFASETIGVQKKLADALEKLTFQNYSPFKPNAILEFFTYSHPASFRRILALRE